MSRKNDNWLTDLRSETLEREAALRSLRESLFRNLCKALPSRAADESFIEDVVQDAMIRILDRLDQFQGRSQFLTWATAIAIRIAMAELRRSRWKDVSLDEVMADAEFVPERAIDSQWSPSAQMERRAILESMQRVLEDQLTYRQRTALLAEMKGMPQDEIARHLGSNRNAIYKLTHDARKKLKQGLEAAGYSSADVVTTISN